VAESDETVNLALSNPSNATQGSQFTATLTIVDVTPDAYIPESLSDENGPPEYYDFQLDGYGISLLTGGTHLDVAALFQDSLGTDSIYYYAGFSYNSDTTGYKPLIAATVTTLSSDPVPSLVKARLNWGGVAGSWVEKTVPGGFSPGSSFTFTVQPASALTSTANHTLSP